MYVTNLDLARLRRRAPNPTCCSDPAHLCRDCADKAGSHEPPKVDRKNTMNVGNGWDFQPEPVAASASPAKPTEPGSVNRQDVLRVGEWDW